MIKLKNIVKDSISSALLREKISDDKVSKQILEFSQKVKELKMLLIKKGYNV